MLVMSLEEKLLHGGVDFIMPKSCPNAWDDFVNIFKEQFLQPPFAIEAAQNFLNLFSRKFSSSGDYVYHVRTQFQNHVSRVTNGLLLAYYMVFLTLFIIR